MFRKGVFAALPAAVMLVLSGCATHPVGMSGEQLAQIGARGLQVMPIQQPAVVRVKTKGQALVGGLLGVVAGSAVASTPQSTSLQGLQEAQEAGTQTSVMVQRAIAQHGHEVALPATPALTMHDELVAKLAALRLPDDAQSYRVVIKQADWTLDYDSMFGADNYRLHYELDTSVLDTQGKEVAYSTCAGQSDDKQALDAWRADDYAKVGAYAKKVGAICGSKLLSDIGLQG